MLSTISFLYSPQKKSMRNSLRISLLLLIFLLSVLIILLPQIPLLTQQLIFAAAILLTGIPHGAMDHLIFFKNNIHSATSPLKKIQSFVFKYIPPMIIYGFIWWIFPWFALFIFLLLSAYHFAETDLLPLELPKNNVTILLQFIYGVIIISNLLLPHPSEVLEILSALPQSNQFLPTISAFINHNKNLPFYLILSWIGILIIQLSILKLLHSQQKGLLIAQAILLPLVLNQLPLYLGFALYFGLWHSVISLQSIYFHLYEKEKSVKKFIASAIPFTVLACIGIGLLIFFGNYTGSLNQTSMALFIGIAVLTLPHLSVMSELFQASKKD